MSKLPFTNVFLVEHNQAWNSLYLLSITRAAHWAGQWPGKLKGSSEKLSSSGASIPLNSFCLNLLIYLIGKVCDPIIKLIHDAWITQKKKKKKNHVVLIHLLVMYPASKECYFGHQIGVGFGLSQSCPDVTPFLSTY